MPNRILKESITTSDEIDALTADEERFFYRLLVVCDDFGRMDAREQILRSKCFPLKVETVKVKDITKWIKTLVKHGLIAIYEVEEKPYLQVTTWDKHQQRRAKHSKFPSIDDGVISNDIMCEQMTSNVPENRESRIEESRNREYEKREYGDHVRLSDDEYMKLSDSLGEHWTKRAIEILDNYKGSSGKKYKSDYRAILSWVVNRIDEEKKKAGVKDGGVNENQSDVLNRPFDPARDLF